MQYKTFIKCQLPRIIDSNGKVKTVQPNWASGYERHTYLFEHAVIDLLKASKNQTKTSKLMRSGFNVVNRIMHLSVKRGMDRRNYSELTFDYLNIDEKSFKIGHQYITVLSHPASGCVLDVEENRTKEACKKLFAKSLTTEQLNKVSAISMDMWKAFIQTAQGLLPNASIVHDAKTHKNIVIWRNIDGFAPCQMGFKCPLCATSKSQASSLLTSWSRYWRNGCRICQSD